MNLEDVINYILTTENLEDIPTIMETLTERVAGEIGVIGQPMSMDQEAPMGPEMPMDQGMPMDPSMMQEQPQEMPPVYF